jgi:hypothetical protein
MLTPGQSARNAEQFDAGGGKKVERRFREPARARKSGSSPKVLQILLAIFTPPAPEQTDRCPSENMASLGGRGKILQFQFDPLDGLNVNAETKKPEATMLKTLRIF